MAEYPATLPTTTDDELLKQIDALHTYFMSQPGMKKQVVTPDDGEAQGGMHQALSGSDFTSEHFGTTWPYLLAGALQSHLVSRHHSGELTPAQVQHEAYQYKERYPYLHSSFVDDVLRNIGYAPHFQGHTILPDPEQMPQGYLGGNGSDYFDVNRG